jgi:hypothetical protein
MAFRTKGWFGPQCPVFPNPPPQALEIYDSQSGTNPEFPLEIATKIYWEASSYRVQADIDYRFWDGEGYESFVDSADETIEWCQAAPFNNPPARQGLLTAKELLCSFYHTDVTILRDFFFLQFRVGKTPEGGGSKIFMPLEAAFQGNSVGFVRLNTGRFPNQIVMGTGEIITPWGNVEVPLFVRELFLDATDGFVLGFTQSASMTITVTAADPAVRYA